MKRLVFVITIVLALLQYRLWIGENSLTEYYSLEKQIALQQATNAKLIDRNEVLKEEIYELRSGTVALEERARNELGMVKEGETFYRVVNRDSNKIKKTFQ
ncbi:cell division protein FtsB [Shewanella gelidii]|uniref:Cell division protein FtsB n=1 Tax=Shewanella gelidii TaxID=1642821 RepID=A0A917JKA9_9GAMM|nr:cell division protein FtsB [Shewanella gelidii]MCL1096591.1 cell division protein FtsB [Shewanella gelidii]GGI68654.1 cell division protein FtsB [Shewanella gelidii]